MLLLQLMVMYDNMKSKGMCIIYFHFFRPTVKCTLGTLSLLLRLCFFSIKTFFELTINQLTNSLISAFLLLPFRFIVRYAQKSDF